MKSTELRIFAVLLVSVLAASEALLAHNTLYPEGEVMQSIYRFFVVLNLPILGLALWKPRVGLWPTVALGALLLPWQTYRNGKWAVIHEEVVGIVRHVTKQPREEGTALSSLDGYTFEHPRMGDHIRYNTSGGNYRID